MSGIYEALTATESGAAALAESRLRSDESDAIAAGTYTSVDRCDCPCGRPIRPSGPSPWFVTQECQRLWYELRTGVAQQVHDPDPVTSTATPAPSRSRWMRAWDRLVRWLA